jgi:hypothetical protein
MKGDHGMKMRLLTQIPGRTLAVMLTLVVAQGLVFGPEARAEGGRGLEGTWLSAVKIVSCDDSDVVFATFESMVTYMRGGTLIEGGAPPSPAVSRSAGHGIWERTGHHTFRTFLRFHSFDELGRRVSIIEVTTHSSLIHGDNPDTLDVLEPYYLSVEGTTEITNINPDDGTVIEVIEGCSEATLRPVLSA